MLAPNPLDVIIQAQISNGAVAIANAITQSPAFLAAINAGLRRPVTTPGPSQAQAVREEIQKVFCGP